MDNELKDDLIKSDLEVRYDEHCHAVFRFRQ